MLSRLTARKLLVAAVVPAVIGVIVMLMCLLLTALGVGFVLGVMGRR